MKIHLTPAGRLWLVYTALLVAACTVALAGCASLSLDSEATAAYGSFVVAEKAGAELIQSPEVPDGTKAKIKSADAKAKPVADALLGAIVECRRVQCDPATLQGALTAALPAITLLAMETAK